MDKSSDNHKHDEEFRGFEYSVIKKNFSSLAEELEGSGNSLDELVEIVDEKEKEDDEIPYYRGYDPNIEDYLARATTKEECLEVIEYCLKMGEITKNDAENYIDRLNKEGPQTFGTRKPGFYDQKL